MYYMSHVWPCLYAALQLLQKLDWVHRDMSVGNIFSYRGGAKLANLEYVKRVIDNKSHEMRTASRPFFNLLGELLIMCQ